MDLIYIHGPTNSSVNNIILRIKQDGGIILYTVKLNRVNFSLSLTILKCKTDDDT